MVNFLQNTNKRHPIAHPWGWAMGCILWVHSLILLDLSHCSAVCSTMYAVCNIMLYAVSCMQYHVACCMQYHAVCSIMIYAVSWYMQYHVACSIILYAVSYCMLYAISCCMQYHVVCYAVSCSIGLCYNRTWLYLRWGAVMLLATSACKKTRLRCYIIYWRVIYQYCVSMSSTKIILEPQLWNFDLKGMPVLLLEFTS